VRRKFDDEDLFQCLERELKKRKEVYPKWVDNGRMSPQLAKRQLEMMEELVEIYREKTKKNNPQQNLFEGAQ
jgi:uncharacterized protein YqeY